MCGCERCHHLFLGRDGKLPRRCPNCKRAHWYRPKARGLADGVPVEAFIVGDVVESVRETVVDKSYSQE